MRLDYCHECDCEEQTEIKTESTIELICDGCGHTEVLTIKRPMVTGYIPLEGDDDDPYTYYGNL